MKLQNLIIIFIIIIIPIIIVFSYYLKLEANTIMMQTDYDSKLIEAARESLEAYIINTTEWNHSFSTLANDKRRQINSSISTFTTSLANKIGIGGTSQENMLQYIPALVYVMYDGYYIYSPTYVPQTLTNNEGVQLYYYNVGTTKILLDIPKAELDGTQIGELAYEPAENVSTTEYISATYTKRKESGEIEYTKSPVFVTEINKAKKVYKHVLKTFVPYSKSIVSNGKNYVVNYTLDNYIKVYGGDISKEGYVLDFANGESITINYDSSIRYKNDTKSIDEIITYEELFEEVPEDADGTTKTYPYVYNEHGEKRYYDTTNGRFFAINGYDKQYLKDIPDLGANTNIAEGEFQKLLIPSGDTIKTVYRLLNSRSYLVAVEGGMETRYELDPAWYEDIDNKIQDNTLTNSPSTTQDCSANNYYVETYYFNKWLNDKDIMGKLGNKEQEIINNIEMNLNLSIANYNSNSKIDFQFPKISNEDWDQALSNISIIAFFQGAKIGLKTYNNYVVVSTAENDEFVSEDSLYYIGADNYYHEFGCNQIDNSTITVNAYKNLDFKINRNNKVDYYKHSYTSGKAYMPCFNCVVNGNVITKDETKYKQAFVEGIARERYQLMEKTRLDQD